MFFIDEFDIDDNKLNIFNKLFELQGSRYPNMLITYREGRRAEDPFSKRQMKLTEDCYEQIMHSNEWLVYLLGDHVFTTNEKSDHCISFCFSNEKLCSFDGNYSTLKLAPELSKEQIEIIESCQLFIKEVRYKVTDPLNEDAWSKMGSAYKTTFCVVGKDMRRALAIVENSIKTMDLSRISSLDCFIEKLASDVNRLVTEEDYADTEGFIQGTIKDVLHRTKKLKNRFHKSITY